MRSSPKDQAVTTSTNERVGAALEEVCTALDTGKPFDRAKLLDQYADVADELLQCLNGLELIHTTAAKTKSSAATGHSSIGPSLASDRVLGDFRIIREIGRGGMGVVYEAEQVSIGRRVALKVLPFAGVLDERHLARFKNESRAAGSLNHPNIVPVYTVGTERGVHFYAMQYVEGQSLCEAITDLRGSRKEVTLDVSSDAETKPIAALSTDGDTDSGAFFRRVAGLGVQAAEAMEHAHQVGIVHRDIKPSNLMVDMAGKLLVTDFGLAQIQGEGNLTMTGDLVGTLRYMSPEQADSERAVLDHRTDIYSLGITLFELLALRPAFIGTDKAKLLRDILENDPPALRSVNRATPRDLETIVLKSIAKEPADRYSTAAKMKDDLQNYLESKPIEARRPHPAHRLTKWVRRHPRPVVTALVVAIFALAGMSVTNRSLEHERAQVAIERDEAIRNLKIGLDAVDRMYTGFAETLIVRDKALSDLQMDFMHQAADLYQLIAARVESRPEFQEMAGHSLLQAGTTLTRLLDFDKAQQAFQRAIGILEAQPDARPQADLAKSWHELGKMHALAANLPDARDAFEESSKVYERLANNPPVTIATRNLSLVLRYDQARVAALMCDEQSAIHKSRDLIRDIAERLAVDADDTPMHILNLLTHAVLAESLLQMELADEAVVACQHALEQSAFALKDWDDHRYAIRALADVKCQLGAGLVEQGNYELAEKSLRESLELLRGSFAFDGTPKEFSFAYMKGEVSHTLMEPDAYCEYGQVLGHLSRVLRETNRVKEAYAMSEEAVRTCMNCGALFPGHQGYFVAGMKETSKLARCRLPNNESNTKTLINAVDWTFKRYYASPSSQTPNVASLNAHAELKCEYGNLWHDLGQQQKALDAWNEAVRLQQQAVDRMPTATFLRQRLRKYTSLVGDHQLDSTP